MASIETRLFNGLQDKYLLLANDEFIRPLSNLGSWQRLRIGVSVAVRGNGTDNINSGIFQIGLCSGRSGTVSGYRCNNYVGVGINGSSNLTYLQAWSYVANSGNPYYSPTGSTNTSAVVKYYNPVSGNVLRDISFGSYFGYLPVVGTGVRRRRIAYVIEITRSPSTGAYTFQVFHPNTSSDDLPPERMLEACDQFGTPVVSGLTWTATGVATLYCSDLTGALDTLSVYWSNSAFPLELYATCVKVIQDFGTVSPSYPFVGGAYDLMTGTTPSQVTTASLLNTGRGWAGPYVFQGTSNGTAT